MNWGMRRRTSGPGHFGFVLSIFVLCLQLLSPGLHSSSQLGSGTGNANLAGLFDEHALCLGETPGSSTGEPASSPEPAKDHHHGFAPCCFWHNNASAPAPSVAAGPVVAFTITGVAFLALTYNVVPARPSGNFAARAPPASA